jgi:hypothetical protein
MTKIENLKRIFADSLLCEIFSIRKEDENEGFSSLRFKSNNYRLRAIEIWDHPEGQYFRIYYAPEIAGEIKNEINGIDGKFKTNKYCTDYRGSFLDVAKSLHQILIGDAAKEAAKNIQLFQEALDMRGWNSQMLIPQIM